MKGQSFVQLSDQPPASIRGEQGYRFLLATKLCVPRITSPLVARPTLIGRINEAIARKLLVITALPGMGKTTLLSAWMQQCPYPSAWLTLDDRDNDEMRFLAYLIAALQRLYPHLGMTTLELLHAPQPPALEEALIPLLNEIGQVPEHLFLVLDDYHLITNQAIHALFSFLLHNQPDQLHILVASRSALPIPLARLRAINQIMEMRERDLRFTLSEASQLFDTFLPQKLSDTEVKELTRRSEGWVTGLQLAALSLRGRSEYQDILKYFTGSYSAVMDYLGEEVFDQQPAHVQQFLLKTALLNRFHPDLCDVLPLAQLSVPQANDGYPMLTWLEQNHLFLIPLDEEHRWYRYHHLFAQFLRERLLRQYPSWATRIHHQASRWYAEQGFYEDAAEHALAINEISYAANLVEQAASTLLLRGEITTLHHWLERLPQTLLQSRLSLAVAALWVQVLRGQAELVEDQCKALLLRLEQQGEHQTELASLSVDVQRNLQGEIAAIAATTAILQGEFSQAERHANKSLSLVDRENIFVRCVAALILGHASRANGNIMEAERSFADAIMYGQIRGSTSIVVLACYQLGQLQTEQGHLRQAAQTYRRVLQLMQEGKGCHLPTTAYVCIELGRILYEWDDREAAFSLIEDGLRIGRETDARDVLLTGFVALTQLKLALDNFEEALQAMEAAEGLVSRIEAGHFSAQVVALRVLFWLKQEKLVAATSWAEQHSLAPQPEMNASWDVVHLTLARLYLATQRGEEALQLLKNMRTVCVTSNAVGRLLAVDVLRSKAFHVQGNTTRALEILSQTLSLAEAEGYIRLFLDEGASLLPLLRRLANQRTQARYIHMLLRAGSHPQSVHDCIAIPAEQVPVAPLQSLLSEREHEILQLIASGRSNQEIAHQLVISPGTVKTHVKNIFRKLDAENRTQAVTQARNLGLLSL